MDERDPVERLRDRGTAAAVMTALALAFQQVFDPRTEEPVPIVESAPDPPGLPEIELHLDDDPARSRIVFHGRA